ncbi:MAG: hypothetical protein ACIAQF_05670 [Phycisphaerales bacterium JB065]
MARGEDQLVAHEIRPGVVWIRPGHRPYTVTDAVLGIAALTVLELLVGYMIGTMTSSRVYGLAAMAAVLLVILVSARIVLHRNLKRTARLLTHAKQIVQGAIEGDPEVTDAMLCAAVFAQRRASVIDVSSIRVADLEKLERRLSRRLPRVWMLSDEPLEIDSGFVPSEEEHQDSLAARRAGLPMYRQGEQIWPSSPVVPMGDQANASSVLLWIAGLGAVMTLALSGASPVVLLFAVVGFILISLAWLARSNPAGYALAVTDWRVRLARRKIGSRLGRGRELNPEDTLVIIREAPRTGHLKPAKGEAMPLVWRFVVDVPVASMPRAIEIPKFDPDRSAWWWVADRSWEEAEGGLSGNPEKRPGEGEIAFGDGEENQPEGG